MPKSEGMNLPDGFLNVEFVTKGLLKNWMELLAKPIAVLDQVRQDIHAYKPLDL